MTKDLDYMPQFGELVKVDVPLQPQQLQLAIEVISDAALDAKPGSQRWLKLAQLCSDLNAAKDA